MKLASTIACLVSLAAGPLAAQAKDPEPPRAVKPMARQFQSRHLGGPVLVAPGVFLPGEAEENVLPFMKAHADLFAGKTVLEIGTGSGVVAVYAAKLGATKVVATDIDPVAVNNATWNATQFDVAGVVEARLVPQSDISAYSVIGEDETFDVIISNPPYSLDLDASKNTPLIDRGDLGLSIVRGLDGHLKPDGRAMLLYFSLFYHHVMVKFARHEGFEVRNHVPPTLSPWEAEALFNGYLDRLLQAEGLDPGALRFDQQRDEGLRRILISHDPEIRPLIEGGEAKRFPGWLVIGRPRS